MSTTDLKSRKISKFGPARFHACDENCARKTYFRANKSGFKFLNVFYSNILGKH